jgi:hypothetical protein
MALEISLDGADDLGVVVDSEQHWLSLSHATILVSVVC